MGLIRVERLLIQKSLYDLVHDTELPQILGIKVANSSILTEVSSMDSEGCRVGFSKV